MPQCWLWLDWWTERKEGNKRSRYLRFISLHIQLMMSYCHPLRRLCFLIERIILLYIFDKFYVTFKTLKPLVEK